MESQEATRSCPVNHNHLDWARSATQQITAWTHSCSPLPSPWFKEIWISLTLHSIQSGFVHFVICVNPSTQITRLPSSVAGLTVRVLFGRSLSVEPFLSVERLPDVNRLLNQLLGYKAHLLVPVGVGTQDMQNFDSWNMQALSVTRKFSILLYVSTHRHTSQIAQNLG